MDQPSLAQAGREPACLDERMLSAYHRDGMLLLPPGFLPAGAAERVAAAAPRILAEESPRRILERDGRTVRSVYAPHRTDPVVAGLVRLPELVGAARAVLGDQVYVHQSKLNVKAAFLGDQWEWHQDYINWLRDDRIPEPNLVNVAVFLDEATEFNGPITFIPGSHREGLLAGADRDGMPLGYEAAPAWVATLTANEKFQVRHDVIQRLAGSNGLVSGKGPAGSVLLFHANVLHASAPNISPLPRSVLLVVYNAVGNAPQPNPNPRPDFLADPDATPLQPEAWPWP